MRSFRKLIAFAASGALVASSTAAVAAAPAPAPAAQAHAPSAWMMLSLLSPVRTVALGGASAAAQPADVPPPPPPPPPYVAAGAGAHVTGEVLPFLLWFGLIAIALGISGPSGRPNSPQ
jgi:hypothetical protein